MVYVFHGDNQKQSRQAFNQSIDDFKNTNILRLDKKQIDLETVNNFLNGTSLLGDIKTLVLANFFSLHPITQKKIAAIINTNKTANIIIWQNKKLTPAQAKLFPQSKVQAFSLPENIFTCLYSIKPKNFTKFSQNFSQIISQNLYDFFLYLLKNHIKKQIASFSPFSKKILIKTYLQLIWLDYQNKNGQLTTPKEIALERIIFNLINS